MRIILHSDLNNFYAAVECLKNPQIADKPVVVTGSRKDRHGVVLAKNQIAKAAGVQTGDVYWQAAQKCGPSLVAVEADFFTYISVSRAVRAVYADYTDTIEAYGIDECWLDITHTAQLFGGGVAVADKIRRRIKEELGLTVSVGVSWNKIFAKLASDMKKPDAVTEISPENYKDTVWPLPVEELLYVGKATSKKLRAAGIDTIGRLAAADVNFLKKLLGKWGVYLHAFANGGDNSRVVNLTESELIKSVGNSLTVYRDLESNSEAEPVIWLLADSVSSRIRELGLGRARTVHITARSSRLESFTRQIKLARPSSYTRDIAAAAYGLFTSNYPWQFAVRSLGVAASGFISGDEQLDIFGTCGFDEKQDRLNAAVDKIRQKYGEGSIRPAVIFKDPKLFGLDIKGGHVIHPYSFFRHG